MLGGLVFWACYRKQTVTDFRFDPTTSEIVVPPGCHVEVEMLRTDPLSDPIRIQTLVKVTPRWWFRPIDRFLDWR
jgi:hypothetical protein